MNPIRRFSSFDELKASELNKARDVPATVLMRHRSFERLMAVLREHILRVRARPRR